MKSPSCFPETSVHSYAAVLQSAVKVVQEAGQIIVNSFVEPRTVLLKGRIDLVTETDLAVEAFLKTALPQCYSGANCYAEESANGALPKTCWIIDPVDGTTNFAHGLPLNAISVALRVESNLQLGIIHVPLLNECYTALSGGGAWCNGRRLRVSAASALEQSLIATGFPYSIAEDSASVLDRLSRILPVARGIRRCGAAALDLAWVAAGRFDGFYENSLQPWDMAAGILLVQEAGGKTTDFSGGQESLQNGEIVAAGPLLHDTLFTLVAGKNK